MNVVILSCAVCKRVETAKEETFEVSENEEGEVTRLRFRVIVNEYDKNGDKTMFYHVNAFGAAIETIVNLKIKGGSSILLHGSLDGKDIKIYERGGIQYAAPKPYKKEDGEEKPATPKKKTLTDLSDLKLRGKSKKSSVSLDDIEEGSKKEAKAKKEESTPTPTVNMDSDDFNAASFFS